MIIQVKVAPPIKWCPMVKQMDEGKFHRMVGLAITIDTDKTMKQCSGQIPRCGGRAWLVTDEAREFTRKVLELETWLGFFVCEHFIEIGD